MTDERDGEYWQAIKQSYRRQMEEGPGEDLTDRQFYERVQGMTEDQKEKLQKEANDIFEKEYAIQKGRNKPKSDKKEEMAQGLDFN